MGMATPFLMRFKFGRCIQLGKVISRNAWKRLYAREFCRIWNFLYKLWRPARLLGHYANWKGPNAEAVSRLDFSSKITTGFYVCLICLSISVIVLIGEIWRSNYQIKFEHWFLWVTRSGERKMCKFAGYSFLKFRLGFVTFHLLCTKLGILIVNCICIFKHACANKFRMN